MYDWPPKILFLLASYETKREIYVITGRECGRSMDQVAIGSVRLSAPDLIERLRGGGSQIRTD